MRGPTPWRSPWAKFSLLVGLLGGAWLALRAFGVDLRAITPDRVRGFVLSFGVWAPAVYLVTYGQPLVPLPASIITITGGLAFGPVWGAVMALAGATLRACSQFLVARLLGREAIARILRGRMATLDQRLTRNGFVTVLLIRLIPNLPFDMQNYGLGFSQVGFGPYALATLIGIIPASLLFVYLGYSLSDPAEIWKLLLAILLIVGLTLAQRAWIARRKGPKRP